MSFADPYRDAEVEEWAARKIQVSFKRDVDADVWLYFTFYQFELSIKSCAWVHWHLIYWRSAPPGELQELQEGKVSEGRDGVLTLGVCACLQCSNSFCLGYDSAPWFAPIVNQKVFKTMSRPVVSFGTELRNWSENHHTQHNNKIVSYSVSL